MAHDTYRGRAANITAPPAAVNIASSTNATPIVVTTAAAHGLSTGDFFVVDNHLTNTAANGLWQAGTVTNTTVVLLGSVGVGVGGATGTTTGFTLGTTNMVTDGNAPAAAEFTVPDAASLDRSVFARVLQQLQLTLATTLADAASVTVGYSSAVMTVPNVSQATSIHLPSVTFVAPFASMRVRLRFRRTLSASAFDAIILSGADTVVTLPGAAAGASWADIDIIGANWRTTAWGGAAVFGL